jgi:RNA polymerase sigma factor (sigma-70 family)
MKIKDPGAPVVQAAAAGDLTAIDSLLVCIQPGVFHLALRMLGQRDDAADASQEILLKVITHLGGFRGDAAFTTWVFQIARNHLLTAATRQRESPEVSLEALGERLQMGLDFGTHLHASLGDPLGHERSLSPEDKVEARELALSCTQNMLMALDREQRLTYMLDAVFGLSSADAAQVLGINAAAYRQRLARARAMLEPFMQRTCGLVSDAAPCRCEKQLPALRHPRGAASTVRVVPIVARAQAEQQFNTLVRLSQAAALFRSQALADSPQAPQAQLAGIRAVLRAEGYWPAWPDHAAGPPPLQ